VSILQRTFGKKESVTALDVAGYFLAQKDEDAGELISNLKIQKLLYYAQGYHLAIYNKPLFHDDIEAWTHGPVVPEVYHRFKSFGDGDIPRPESLNFDKFDAQTREFLDEIYNVMGQFSAWKLRNMTHREPPWRDTFESGEKIISHKALRDYFKTLVEE
jgi:uncharacterized phage-associated protein